MDTMAAEGDALETEDNEKKLMEERRNGLISDGSATYEGNTLVLRGGGSLPHPSSKPTTELEFWQAGEIESLKRQLADAERRMAKHPCLG